MLTVTLSLTHTHTHTLSLSLSHSHTCMHICMHACTCAHTHTHTFSLSLSLSSSLSLTHIDLVIHFCPRNSWEESWLIMNEGLLKSSESTSLLCSAGFVEIEQEDQIRLIKQGAFEVMMTRFALLVNHDEQTMLDPTLTLRSPRSVWLSCCVGHWCGCECLHVCLWSYLSSIPPCSLSLSLSLTLRADHASLTSVSFAVLLWGLFGVDVNASVFVCGFISPPPHHSFPPPPPPLYVSLSPPPPSLSLYLCDCGFSSPSPYHVSFLSVCGFVTPSPHHVSLSLSLSVCLPLSLCLCLSAPPPPLSLSLCDCGFISPSPHHVPPPPPLSVCLSPSST